MQVRPDSLFARRAERIAQAANDNQSRAADSQSSVAFLDLIKQGVGSVNQLQQTSSTQVEQLLSGEDVQSAEVLTSLQKADMAFRLLVQIRNKLMDAFQEINNIRV